MRNRVGFIPIERANSATLISLWVRKKRWKALGSASSYPKLSKLTSSSITNDDIKTYDTAEIDLKLTYKISVYASKPGYQDSEIATATLCWIEQEPYTEGITDEDGVMEVKTKPMMIQTENGIISILGIDNGIETQVYDNKGMMRGSVISIDNQAIINTNLTTGDIAIIKVREKHIKVVIK